MKNTEIPLSVSELKTVLPGLSKVASKRATLPVLGCVKLERDQQGEVSIQATDLDDCVTVRLKDPVSGVPTSFLVPFEPLSKAVKAGSKQDRIVLVDAGKQGLKLRTFIGSSPVDQNLDVIPVNEWPPQPIIKETGILLEPELRTALQEAFEWSSEDESRLIINSAYLDVADPKAHYVIGTNGRALFSANSFNLGLKESLIVPRRKFLGWPGIWEDESCRLSFEPGKEHPKTKARDDGWLQFKTDRWTFITRQIPGNFPNWKQVVPNTTSGWTSIQLTNESVKQILQVIPKLPGDYDPNYPIRLRVTADRFLIEGKGAADKEWTSIPVPEAAITGKSVSVGLNRHYLTAALRQGLDFVRVEDSLTPLLFTKGGKRVVIMPVRLEDAPVKTATAPTSKEPPTPPSQTPASSQTTETANERTEMPRTAANPTTTPNQNATEPANDSAIKSVILQVERIKEALKEVIGEFNDVLASLKVAEKEKKATEKEIESIRATLKTIQNVKI